MANYYGHPYGAMPPGYQLNAQSYGNDTRPTVFTDTEAGSKNQINSPYSGNPTQNAYVHNQMIPGLTAGPPASLESSNYPNAKSSSINLPYQSLSQSSPYHRELQQDLLPGSSNVQSQMTNNYTASQSYQSDNPPTQASNPPIRATDVMSKAPFPNTETQNSSNTNAYDYRGLESYHPPPLSQSFSGTSTHFSDARNDAKRAILDLVIQGIHFDQLLDENTGTEEFLVDIWKEIGLPLPTRFTASPKTSHADTSLAIGTSNTAKESQRSEAHSSAQGIVRNRRPEHNLAPAVPPYGTVTLQDLSPHTTSSADKSYYNTKPIQPNETQQPVNKSPLKRDYSSSNQISQLANQQNPSKPSTVITTRALKSDQRLPQSTKATEALPAQEERKDRIARLIALKNSKSTQNSTIQTLSASQSTLPLDKTAATQQEPSGQTTRDSTRINRPTSDTPTSSATNAKVPSAEIRSRARGREATALALRKIEEQRKIAAAQKARSPNLAQVAPHTVPPEVYDHSDSSQITTPLQLSDSSASHGSQLYEMATHSQTHDAQNFSTHNVPGDRNGDALNAAMGIPGLFMTSPVDQLIAQSQFNPPDNPSSTGSSEARGLSTKSRLKRPVAADFDNEPVRGNGAFKRPFGQAREESRLVIDVSDDDSSENDEIISKPKDQNGTSQQPASKPPATTTASTSSLHHQNSVKDLPPLSDFPSRRLTARNFTQSPKSGLATPPVMHSNGKSSPSALQDLKEKEQAIQRMQKKIAELEKKKAEQTLKRAQSPKVDSSDTTKTLVSETTSNEVIGAVTKIFEDATSITPPDYGTEPEPHPPVEVASTKTRTDHDYAAERERKRQRRVQLQSGLSGMYAEAEEARRRIAEYEREQKRWEAILKAKMDKRNALMDELEMLGIEVNESNIAELEIVKKKEELSELKSEIAQDKDATQSYFVDLDTYLTALSQAALDRNHPSSAIQSPRSAKSPDLATDHKSLASEGSSENVASPSTSNASNKENIPRFHEHSGNPLVSQARSMVDSTEEGEISEDSNLEDGKRSVQGELSPKPSIAQEVEPTSASSNANMEAREREEKTSAGEGDTPLSDTNEELHREKEEESLTDSMDIEDSDSDSDSDSFEPPDAGASTEVDQSTDQPSIDNPMDDGSQAVLQQTLQQPLTMMASPANTQPVSSEKAQIDEPPKPVHSDDSALAIPVSSIHFEPYVSPLKHMRSYRNHPEYLQEVSGGFQSLTYNNNIDIQRPICQYEASDGICNDPACNGQHFKDMTQNSSSDHAFLREITKEIAGHSPEQKKQFTAGLEQLLAELSSQQQPFPVVASSLISYRRKAIDDQTALLML